MKYNNWWREKRPNIGKQVMVHAYKYNGWLYRTWEYPTVILSTSDYFILACENTLILTDEYNGKRTFKHNKPEIFFWVFFKNNWFNMIIDVSTHPITMKINLASKYLYEESTIKYIDFELDYKVNISGEWKELDRHEFVAAIEEYHYPDELIDIIESNAAEMINFITTLNIKEWMDEKFISKLNQLYNEVKNNEEWTK